MVFPRIYACNRYRFDPAPPMCLCVRVQNCEALQTAHALNSDCLVVGLRFAYKRGFSIEPFWASRDLQALKPITSGNVKKYQTSAFAPTTKVRSIPPGA